MFQQFHEISFHAKLMLASGAGLGAIIADAAGDVQSWEQTGLKALLIFTVIFLTNLVLTQHKENKAEIREIWAAHKLEIKEREDKMNAAMEAQTKALGELSALTREQTDYFKAVTRNIVDERLKSKLTS